MNEDQHIELRKELEELKNELHKQQKQISELRKQLVQNRKRPFLSWSSDSSGGFQSWSLENFIGLRLIHFIGIVVLVIGLSIGVKYAIDKNFISEIMRIGLAYAAGIILLLLSFFLRKKYTLFSAILFSGGMASLYFTTYAGYVYYSMFSFPLAFVIMIVLTVYTIVEAIRYNRQEIALLGLIGAYGIPFLISKNSDRADLFFFYIALINSGVAFLTIKKEWKNVGRAAQAITWILFIAWASMRFNIKLQWVGLGFMAFFFLLFLFMAISFKMFQKKPLTLNDTYQVLLNNLALYLASLFLFGYSFANADIARLTIVLSIFVAIQSLLIYYFWKEERYTIRTVATEALILFVLFIGFNWGGFMVTLLWLLTAVVIFITGFFMRSVPMRMAAIVLIGITLGKLVLLDSLSFTTVQKVIAYLTLGVLLLVVSFFYQKFREQLFRDEEMSNE